jgi:hypothetical protein
MRPVAYRNYLSVLDENYPVAQGLDSPKAEIVKGGDITVARRIGLTGRAYQTPKTRSGFLGSCS